MPIILLEHITGTKKRTTKLNAKRTVTTLNSVQQQRKTAKSDENQESGIKKDKPSVPDKTITAQEQNVTEEKEQENSCVNNTKKSKKLKENDFRYHFSTNTMENKKKIEEIQATRDKLCKYMDKQFENSTWLVENVKLVCE